MIRATREYNETVTPNDFEIKRLRAALPEYFDKNGAFMLDRFQESLKADNVSITKEGYELKFLGKSYAKYLTSTDTETVVVPDLAHNSQPENKNSENLYIVGDNLDALKHLLGSYTGQVKCRLIDPPYNTGSDGFVYNDDFGFTPAQLVDKIGLSEDEAGRVLDLQGKSSHSAWLTFMYPRLQLAKELLSDDGAVFISIDDNEYFNLKGVCDEVFGEQNCVSTVVVQTNPRGRTFDRFVAKTHEYLLAYTKTDSPDAMSLITKTENALASYKNKDDNGTYRLLELRNRNPIFNRQNRPNLFFPFYADPDTCEVSLFKQGTFTLEIIPQNSKGIDGCWTWSKKRAEEFGHLLVARQATTGKWSVFRKDYLDETSSTTKAKALWLESGLNHERGKERVRDLFQGLAPFSFPKSTDYVKKVLELGAAEPGSVVLDFFSGSATTADALLELKC
ncbi:MAG: site-specific DNA-methyltransferase [Lawsonella clevelandensis]